MVVIAAVAVVVAGVCVVTGSRSARLDVNY